MTIPQWEACKVCGGDHWTKDHRASLDPRGATTPTAPLAEALHATLGSVLPSETEADWDLTAAAILAALDAAGWAVTNDPSILLVIKERLDFRDRAEAAEVELARLRAIEEAARLAAREPFWCNWGAGQNAALDTLRAALGEDR